MRTTVQILILFLLLVSCDKNEPSTGDQDLLGQWQLAQVLVDPGDGSGTFTDIKSTKTITFSPDQTIEVVGGFCGMDTGTDGVTEGTYDPLEKTITPDDCTYNEHFPIRITYSIEEGYLYIYFPCIEPCAHKYRRV